LAQKPDQTALAVRECGPERTTRSFDNGERAAVILTAVTDQCRNHPQQVSSLVRRLPCRSGHIGARYFAGATAPDGRTGAVAKFAGSSPVRLWRNATMSRMLASSKVTPSCTRAMTFTASGNVATDPSWK
jgi:hypothetical protein